MGRVCMVVAVAVAVKRLVGRVSIAEAAVVVAVVVAVARSAGRVSMAEATVAAVRYAGDLWNVEK